MGNPNTVWASYPAAQLSLSCSALYVSALLMNLSHQRSRKPCLAPSQLAIHTQLEKLELSDIIYIIKGRATIEGKVYVKVSKIVLINVQSHQAWCTHLRSNTENSPWGGSLCGRQKHSTLQDRGCKHCKGATWAALHQQSMAVGCSPTQPQWDFQIPSHDL